MHKMSRLVSVALLIFITSCTTTSTSFTTPYATSDTTNVGSEYDKEKAASTRLSLGLRYLSQDDYEKAKFNLDKAYGHLPNNENVLRGFAWYYEQVSETELAEEYYKRALKVNDKNPALLNQYGVFLCRNNRLQESLKLFEASLTILSNKDVGGTYENAATCSLMAGEVEQAEAMFRKALNHNPRQRDSLLGMAVIEYEKGRYNRTRSYLSRYELIADHSPRSLWLAIRTESKMGNMNLVASYAIKLDQLYPDSQQNADYLDTRSQWLK
jgi:type IV pilus assembly protein PilF